MQNVEFKAELRDPAIARAIARQIGANHVVTTRQTDTYYRVTSGRLKKREAVVDGVPEPVEVIRYDRDDRTRAKISRFEIYTEEESAERYGSLPLPIWVKVEKTREVFFLDNTRIHLDEVEGLGRFIEFEVLVTPQQNVARAHSVIDQLRSSFGPALGEPIAVSYSDLLAAETRDDPG